LSEDKLEIYRPDGERFATYIELAQRAELERQDKEQAQQLAEQAQQRAEQERQRAEQAEAQLQALRNLLQERGIDPEQL
jgi:hypothetical protein